MAGFEYAVALTGGIGTGKSTVAKIFSLWGFPLIDADKIAHEVLDREHNKIEHLFGKGLSHMGKVDRKALGAIVFANGEKRLELEKFLHPLIFDEIQQRSIEEDREKKPYLIDIPLFFEKMHYPIAKSLLVYTSEEAQVKRVMKRNGFTKEETLLRISSQMDIQKKVPLASYVIDNNAEIDDLQEACEKIKKMILKDFG